MCVRRYVKLMCTFGLHDPSLFYLLLGFASLRGVALQLCIPAAKQLTPRKSHSVATAHVGAKYALSLLLSLAALEPL